MSLLISAAEATRPSSEMFFSEHTRCYSLAARGRSRDTSTVCFSSSGGVQEQGLFLIGVDEKGSSVQIDFERACEGDLLQAYVHAA